MDLDFKTVRALSSPTRIKILNEVLENESTPTSLSDELDRSKSTISSHLDTLLEAGLVEKDSEEGRRRVVYNPTRKARTIVEGKERKVKFSVTSSIVSGIAGVAMLGYSQAGFAKSAAADRAQAGAMMLSQEADSASTMTSQNGAPVDPATAVLAVSLFFLGVSVSGLAYGFFLNRLGS